MAQGPWPAPLLGAFILVPLSEVLQGAGGLRIVFYGVLLVVFIVALPEGIFHYRAAQVSSVRAMGDGGKMSESPLLEVYKLFQGLWRGPCRESAQFRTLHRGELLGIIGPNGSGKTTTVNLITGFVKATSGQGAL